jgi:hypothetical protein
VLTQACRLDFDELLGFVVLSDGDCRVMPCPCRRSRLECAQAEQAVEGVASGEHVPGVAGDGEAIGQLLDVLGVHAADASHQRLHLHADLQGLLNSFHSITQAHGNRALCRTRLR